MKQRKRLLSVLLVFAMVISLCSSMGTVVAKAAEGGVTFVSRTDFVSKLEEMNAAFTGFDDEGNTTIKSITFAYAAPDDGYTMSDVNFAESETEVIHGAYKETEDGSGYDVYVWAGNGAKIMAPEYCSSLFRGCKGVQTFDFTNFDTSNVTTMNGMFWNCQNLENLNLSGWANSNVTDMTAMFRACTNLKEIEFSDFNTSNVTNMFSMFYDCTSLETLDLSSFDTSNVELIYYMFFNCSNLKQVNVTSVVTHLYLDKPNPLFRDWNIKLWV